MVDLVQSKIRKIIEVLDIENYRLDLSIFFFHIYIIISIIINKQTLKNITPKTKFTEYISLPYNFNSHK